MNPTHANRWIIAVAGIVMQIALGAVYAWSVFRIPLSHAYGWSVSQVTQVFELAIFMVGAAAFLGGLWMKRSGPRPVAIVASLCYGLGWVLAGQAGGNLWLLTLSYQAVEIVGEFAGIILPA